MGYAVRVIIVGGGVIGLGIGWKLAKSGCQVTLYERNQVGRGASWAAAGMLSPLAEAHTQEPELLKLGLDSSNCYPGWVDELEKESQISIDYRRQGTLMVALDRDDRADLQHHFEMQKGFIMTNRMELAFKGLPKRGFQYTFKMIPKSAAEAAEIKDIITQFKKICYQNLLVEIPQEEDL